VRCAPAAGKWYSAADPGRSKKPHCDERCGGGSPGLRYPHPKMPPRIGAAMSVAGALRATCE